MPLGFLFVTLFKLTFFFIWETNEIYKLKSLKLWLWPNSCKGGIPLFKFESTYLSLANLVASPFASKNTTRIHLKGSQGQVLCGSSLWPWKGFVPTKSNSRFLGFCPLLGVYLDFESKWVSCHLVSRAQGSKVWFFYLSFCLILFLFCSLLFSFQFLLDLVSVFVLFIFWIWFCCSAYQFIFYHFPVLNFFLFCSSCQFILVAYQFIFITFPVLGFCSVLPISSS